MYRTLLFIALWALAGVGAWAQEDFGESKPKPRYYLGINLMPSASGDLYHFAILEKLGTRPRTHFNSRTNRNEVEINKYTRDTVMQDSMRANYISRMEFIQIALGRMSSDANPNGENLLKSFQIDTLNQFWDPIANLWRLRYNGHPFYPNDNSGWFVPNPQHLFTASDFDHDSRLYYVRDSLQRIYDAQQKLLAEAGIYRFSDFIYGEKLFKLLKNMQSEQWVKSFVQAPLPQDVAEPLKGNAAPVLASAQSEIKRPGKATVDDMSSITISKVSTSSWEQLTNGPNSKKKK